MKVHVGIEIQPEEIVKLIKDNWMRLPPMHRECIEVIILKKPCGYCTNGDIGHHKFEPCDICNGVGYTIRKFA